METCVSPDGKIKKDIVLSGRIGNKPFEGSQCTITISDYPPLEEYANKIVTIGDNEGDLWRALDICLMTMYIGEKSKFSIDNVPIVLELHDLEFNGFIYEWNALKKFHISTQHKEKGNVLFQQKNNKEAGFRFAKALKILSSIPIDVEEPPRYIDGVALTDIKKLKATLYNNLSSCYLRNELWDMVVGLCLKVFVYDSDNVKALYKIGVAYRHDRNFEKAYESFLRVLELEPENKASAEQLHAVKTELKKAEIKMNEMMKKMFPAALEN